MMTEDNSWVPLHVVTPLIESKPLSKVLSSSVKEPNVILKLDVLQPSVTHLLNTTFEDTNYFENSPNNSQGSFKIRGIGHRCNHAVKKQNCKHLISSSGGNAGNTPYKQYLMIQGLAVAYSGNKLGVSTTIVVPETCFPFMREKMADEGAKVIVHGKVWNDADAHARKILEQDKDAVYIHPFDDPLVWEGHTTIISEMYQQLKDQRAHLTPNTPEGQVAKPDVIVTVVGGGGLLMGIVQGLHKVGWADVPVIACETDGAASFYEAMKKKEHITLPDITSIAKTLGAKQVCKELYDTGINNKHTIIPVKVTDRMAVDALTKFSDDHRCLVEPACGAGLSALYSKVPELVSLLEGKQNPLVAVIVCGGNMVTLKSLQEWATL